MKTSHYKTNLAFIDQYLYLVKTPRKHHPNQNIRHCYILETTHVFSPSHYAPQIYTLFLFISPEIRFPFMYFKISFKVCHGVHSCGSILSIFITLGSYINLVLKKYYVSKCSLLFVHFSCYYILE